MYMLWSRHRKAMPSSDLQPDLVTYLLMTRRSGEMGTSVLLYPTQVLTILYAHRAGHCSPHISPYLGERQLHSFHQKT